MNDLLLPNRLIRRVSPQRLLLVRFVGSLCSSARSPLRAPTHAHTHTHTIWILFVSSCGYFWKEIIRGKNIVFWAGIVGSYSPLLFSSSRLLQKLFVAKTHGFLCPKGAVALRKALDSFFWKHFFRCMGVLSSNGADLSASCVDYISWNAQWETRTFLGLPDRESKARFICLHAFPVQRYTRFIFLTVLIVLCLKYANMACVHCSGPATPQPTSITYFAVCLHVVNVW